MKSHTRTLLAILLFTSAWAKPVIIKMATLAPQGSDMHGLMVEMGQRWKEATDGQVALRLYPSGVVGDERDMIRKIRIGQIHGAAVTTEGLSEISRNVFGFLVPMIFQDYDDVDYIREHIAPGLAAEFEDNGFVIINWGDVGWAYWFARDPLILPQDLKKMRIFTWAGDYQSTKLWQTAGYESVQLAYIDVLSGLQTGLIDALATPAIMALSNQFFGPAPHMLEMKWGLVTGGTVIDKKTWEKISPEHREQMLVIAKEIGLKQQEINRHMDEKAIEVMEEYGLKVHHPTAEEYQSWLELTRSFYPEIRGSLIPAEIFDRVVQLMEERRAQETEAE